MHSYPHQSTLIRFTATALLASTLCVGPLAHAAKHHHSCSTCGKVISISVTHHNGQGSIVGKVGGGLAGGMLGSQIGGGRGKMVGMIAGTIGGAYVGNKMEKRVRSSKTYHVHVKLNNGSRHTVNFDHAPKLLTGQKIQLKNGQLIRR